MANKPRSISPEKHKRMIAGLDHKGKKRTKKHNYSSIDELVKTSFGRIGNMPL